MQKQDVDDYFVINYKRLIRKYGPDATNDLYAHFARVLMSPEMVQPRNLGACVHKKSVFNAINAVHNTPKYCELTSALEPSYEMNDLYPDALKLVNALEFLPKCQRIYAVQYFKHGLTCREIGVLYGKSETTVKLTIYAAVRKLKNTFNIQR